jgi:hypothetical protein
MRTPNINTNVITPDDVIICLDDNIKVTIWLDDSINKNIWLGGGNISVHLAGWKQ